MDESSGDVGTLDTLEFGPESPGDDGWTKPTRGELSRPEPPMFPEVLVDLSNPPPRTPTVAGTELRLQGNETPSHMRARELVASRYRHSLSMQPPSKMRQDARICTHLHVFVVVRGSGRQCSPGVRVVRNSCVKWLSLSDARTLSLITRISKH